jgi:hypothetical protein
MNQRFQVGDIVQQISWGAYYLVTSTTASAKFSAKEHYLFQLITTQATSHERGPVVMRARDYIDAHSHAAWVKIG